MSALIKEEDPCVVSEDTLVSDKDDPYVYVDGKKELKDGGGMIKESGVNHKGGNRPCSHS